MIVQRIIFLSGAIVSAMPFLGFPGSWKTIVYVFLGISVAIISFLIRDFKHPIKLRSPKKDNNTSVFVENGPVVPEKKRIVRRKLKESKLSSIASESSSMTDTNTLDGAEATSERTINEA